MTLFTSIQLQLTIGNILTQGRLIPMNCSQWGSEKVNGGITFFTGFHLVVTVGETERAQLDGPKPRGSMQPHLK